MITRKQYIADSSNLHREYYAQFITPRVRANVADLDIKALQHDFAIEDARGDVTKKVYPLSVWDRMGGGISASAMKEAGDHLTLAGSVCIHKEAARQRVEAEGKQ